MKIQRPGQWPKEAADLTVREVAELLKETEKTVRGRIQRGEIEARRQGRRYRISVAALQAYRMHGIIALQSALLCPVSGDEDT